MAYDSGNLLPTPSEYATPKQLEAIREYSKALLQGPGQQKVQMPLQGVSNMVSALMGGHLLHDAGQREKFSSDYETEGKRPESIGQPVTGPSPVGTVAKPPVSTGKRAFAAPAEELAAALAQKSQGEDAPVVASSGTGSAFGGLPGFAPGEKPIGWDEGDYDSRVPGKMSLAAEPGVQAIQRALRPGNTQMAQAGGGGIVQPGNYLPPELLPSRPQYEWDKAKRVIGGFYQTPGERDFALKSYLGQKQPIDTAVAGGTIRTPGSGVGPQVFIPELEKATKEYPGGLKEPAPYTMSPNGEVVYAPEKGGAVAPKTTPQDALPPDIGLMPYADEGKGGPLGMLGAKPPDVEGTKTAQYLSPSTVGKINESGSLIAEQERKKKQATETADLFSKKYNETVDAGQRAQGAKSKLELAKQLVDDPNFVSGIFADPRTDLKRLQAWIGGDPTKARASEVFQKIMSGDILEEMKVLLKGLGQVRVAEIDLLGKATANRYNTPEANKTVLELMSRTYQRASDMGKLANLYAQGWRRDEATGKTYRVAAEGLDYGWDRVQQKFLEKNPIVSDDEIKKYDSLFGTNKGYNPQKTEKVQKDFREYVQGKGSPPASGGAAPSGVIKYDATGKRIL